MSYSQICVFDSTLQSPFNPWSDEDVARYFVKSARSVSFRTEQESATYSVELTDVDHNGSKNGLIRSIEASLTISDGGSIEIASISDGFRITEPTSGS
ncbi:MAG: hypothetical protein IPG63_18450 [Xanthomonadales bacterium]|nr:hypothetical protein [Xanthomonadales bacterium]